MAKSELKAKAVELRDKGYSYNLIRRQVPVSKSTLTLWLRGINFSPNKEVQNRVRGAALKVSKWSHRNKMQSLETARKRALTKLGALSSRDLFLLGLGVYIGEGTKTKEHVRVINSDPRVIALAIRWFEESFGLKTKNFKITLHLYPDNDVKKSIAFWSRITNIPRSHFGKTQIDRRKKTLKKRGMLKHGTAHLYVQSRGEKEFGVLLFRTIIALISEAYRQVD